MKAADRDSQCYESVMGRAALHELAMLVVGCAGLLKKLEEFTVKVFAVTTQLQAAIDGDGIRGHVSLSFVTAFPLTR